MSHRICLGLAVIFAAFAAPAFAYDWSANPGDGSAENPYQISTPEQLARTLFCLQSILS